jgi:chloramphenicol 3-O-phosphotransferase
MCTEFCGVCRGVPVWFVGVRVGMGGAAARHVRAPAGVVEGATEIVQQCAFLTLSKLVSSVSVSGEHWAELNPQLAS